MKLKMLFLLLVITPFFGGIIRYALFLSIAIICTIFLFEYLRKKQFVLSLKGDEVTAKVIICTFAIVAYSIINMLINGISFTVLERLIQLYACFSVLIFTAEYEWKKQDYIFCLNIIRFVVIACILVWPLSGFRTNYYNGIFTRGNSLGGALFCYMGIYLAIPRKYTKLDKIIIVLMFFLIYIANSRSALLSLVVFLCLRFIFIKNNKFNKKYIFLVLIIAFTFFPYLYVSLYNSELRDTLDMISWKYFRKRFFSGRQVLWDPLIEGINQKLMLGYGLDMQPEKLMGISVSSHNWYLQMLLQIGVIGYAIMINILRMVWNTLYNLKNNKISLNCSAFMIGVLLWQCFEVSITQNNVYIGIMVWFVLGIGINNSLINISKSINEKD